MNDAFLEKVIRLLVKGVKGAGFISFMVKNRESWKGLDYKDVEKIIHEIRFNHLGLYAFLPFCYKMIGIDLFYYYKIMDKTVWKDLSNAR